MVTGTYKIAELIVQIQSIHNQVHEQCSAYRFNGTPDLVVTTTQAQIDFERDKSNKEDALEGLPAQNYTDEYMETLAVYRQLAKQMLYRNTLLFHGSAIAVDGEAVLFTAQSGTGKSTHTRLWRRLLGERCVMVNDDKPLLRLTEDGVLVCGTPWDGKHKLSTNCAVPLKAICILERGKENAICQISVKEALPMLLQQSFRPADPADMAQMLKVINLLTEKLSFYRLQCTIGLAAARLSYETMLGKSTE